MTNKTQNKEMEAEKIIQQYEIWERLFPGYKSVKKCTDKENQLAGIDFWLTDKDGTVHTIDIKGLSGYDYTFKPDYLYSRVEDYPALSNKDGYRLNQMTVEIWQNGIRTFTKSKKTDYVLFIFNDRNGISYSMVDYKDILKIVDKFEPMFHINPASQAEINKSTDGKYLIRTSFNGTGNYVCFPTYSNILTGNYRH